MPYYESFDKTRIHYIEQKGKTEHTLFFLHGWTSGIQFNDFLLPCFDEFNTIMWDARCHGKSQVDKNATLTSMAMDLKHFLTKIYKHDYPVVAIGHSMGALTIMEYFRKYGTGNIWKIVFIDQSPKLITDKEFALGVYGNYTQEDNLEMVREFQKDIIEGHKKLSRSGLNKEYARLMQEQPELFVEKYEYLATLDPEALIHIWNSMAEADYRSVLSQIDIPVLLLYGSKSQFYTRDTGRYMKSRIPNNTLYCFENGDHAPFVSSTQDFVLQVKNFVSSPSQ